MRLAAMLPSAPIVRFAFNAGPTESASKSGHSADENDGASPFPASRFRGGRVVSALCFALHRRW